MAKWNTGEKNGLWKGGRSVASNGYVLIRVGVDHPLADVRGYAYEHRVVAEQKKGIGIMGANSTIEWCDHTWNPWWGCIEVSDGCTRCYARTFAHRYGHQVWGPAKTTGRRMMSENYWRQPHRWNKADERSGQRARVFCASMADVFEDHPALIEPRARLIQLIHDTPALDWLLLTKRPEGWSDRLHEVVRKTHNGADVLASQWLDGDAPPNVWIGTSVEDQRRADERIPALLDIPARIRFLSCEPLLGPVDLSKWLPDLNRPIEQVPDNDAPIGVYDSLNRDYYPDPAEIGISWIIVGGESGHGARPMHPDWARGLRDQCAAAGVPFFFKQWGEFAPRIVNPPVMTTNGMEFPDKEIITRFGKKAAGRLLDGVEHNAYPA